MFWILLLFGLICGTITGLVSVGGGIILIFLLVYLLPLFFKINLSMEIITGISIMQTFFTSSSGSFYYIRKHLFEFKASMIMGIPAFIGGILGALLAELSSDLFIELVFVITSILASVAMQIPYNIMKSRNINVTMIHHITIVFISLLIGVVGGVIGVGAGFLFIPILIFVYKTDIKKAIGSSLIIISFLSFGGIIAKLNIGTINFEYGLIIITGGVIGAQIGGFISKRMNPLILKKIAAFSILLVSIKLVYDLIV